MAAQLDLDSVSIEIDFCGTVGRAGFDRSVGRGASTMSKLIHRSGGTPCEWTVRTY